MMMNVTIQRQALLKSLYNYITRPNCGKCQFYIKNKRDKTSAGFCQKIDLYILFPNSPRCGGLLYKP